MDQWDNQKLAIRRKRLTSKSWASDQRSIIGIFDSAEAFGLSSDIVRNIKICNLRTIIKVAKGAIEVEDALLLADLFALAEELSTADLRLAIKSRVPEELDVRPNEGIGVEQFLIAVDTEQLARLEWCSRMHFTYRKTNPPSTWHSLGRYPSEVN
jgi:hypothetical protein